MKKIKCLYGASKGRGHKREKGAGENAKMLPKAKEREKQETKWVDKLKCSVSNLVETVSDRKKAAVKKDKSKNEAGNLLEMETNMKEEEGEMPAGNLQILSLLSLRPSQPPPAPQTCFVAFWNRACKFSSSPSFT